MTRSTQRRRAEPAATSCRSSWSAPPTATSGQDPYNKLFEDRIIFLGVQIDDASADDVMAQLLCLESHGPGPRHLIYINSPGGSFTALTAIYDTMQYIKPDIQTVCMGQAASAAAVLLAAGTPGKRMALPNARVLIHQPAIARAAAAQASDIEIQANEMLRMRTWLEETLAKHSNRADRAGPQRHRARQDPHGASRPWSTVWSTRCSAAARRAPAWRVRDTPD